MSNLVDALISILALFLGPQVDPLALEARGSMGREYTINIHIKTYYLIFIVQLFLLTLV